MSKRKNPAAVALGRRGGNKRKASMTPLARSESARNAVEARWKKYYEANPEKAPRCAGAEHTQTAATQIGHVLPRSIMASAIGRGRKRPGGRPPKVIKPCKFCGAPLGARERQAHEPMCPSNPSQSHCPEATA